MMNVLHVMGKDFYIKTNVFMNVLINFTHLIIYAKNVILLVIIVLVTPNTHVLNVSMENISSKINAL